MSNIPKKNYRTIEQVLAQDYTQRLIEWNIVRQKLSRSNLYRLRPHRLRVDRLCGGRGESSEIMYSSISRKKN